MSYTLFGVYFYWRSSGTLEAGTHKQHAKRTSKRWQKGKGWCGEQRCIREQGRRKGKESWWSQVEGRETIEYDELFQKGLIVIYSFCVWEGWRRVLAGGVCAQSENAHMILGRSRDYWC